MSKEEKFITDLIEESVDMTAEEGQIAFDFLEKLKLSNLNNEEEKNFLKKIKQDIDSFGNLTQQEVDQLERDLLSASKKKKPALSPASSPVVGAKPKSTPVKKPAINELDKDEDGEKPVGKSQFKPKSGFAAAVLANAKKDLGVIEDPKTPNDGPRIREYFKNFGFNQGPGFPWCAAAVSTWMKEAGGGPIAGSMGSLQIMQQFKSAGYWKDRKDLTPEDLVPGNVAVWNHPEIGPGRGHVGIVATSNGSGGFTSISGNTRGPNDYNPNQVAIHNHSIKDSNFLGLGMLSDYQ